MNLSKKASKKLNNLFKCLVKFPLPKFTDLPNDMLSVLLAIFTLPAFTAHLSNHSCRSTDCLSCQTQILFCSFKDSFGLQDSIILLSFFSTFSTFIEKFVGLIKGLHLSEQTSSGMACKCCVCKELITLCLEHNCSCGLVAGKAIGMVFKVIELPAVEFILPESAQKEQFNIYGLNKIERKMLLKLGKNSVLLRTSENFIENFKRVFKKHTLDSPLCLNPECSLLTPIIRARPHKGNHLIFMFNYNSVHMSIFNSIQLLSFLPNPLDLSSLTINSSESLYLTTFIFTDCSTYTICTLKDTRWFELTPSSYNLIGKGLWADVAFHVIQKKLFPFLIFYSKTPQIASKYSKFQLIILETLSYSLDFLGDYDSIQRLMLNKETFYNDRLEIFENCPFCLVRRKKLEKCSRCGFVEGDWECRVCFWYNFGDNRVCCKCEMGRIDVGEDFRCKCGLVSAGSKNCFFCPVFVCKKCEMRKSPYTSLHCRTCDRFTDGVSGCRTHVLWCYTCYLSS